VLRSFRLLAWKAIAFQAKEDLLLIEIDYCICPVYWKRNDFQKGECQGENPVAKGFSPWTPFPKTLICFQLNDATVLAFTLDTASHLEFLPEGSGTGFLHKKRVHENFPLPSSAEAIH
jgi:hypothetical protein